MPILKNLDYTKDEIAEWIKPVVDIIGMEPAFVYTVESDNDENGYVLTVLHFPVGDPWSFCLNRFGIGDLTLRAAGKRIGREVEAEWADEGAMQCEVVWGHSSLLVILSGLI